MQQYESLDNTNEGLNGLTLVQRQLIALLRLAITGVMDNCLEVCKVDWKKLYHEAEKQSVVGICWAGIERLPKNRLPDMDMLMEWLGQAEYIKTRNEQLNEECCKVQKLFRERGLQSTILKGHGLGNLYGDLAMSRTSGDIDIWLDGNRETIIDTIQKIKPCRDFDFKHIHLNVMDDTDVEVHWTPSVSTNPLVNKRLQAFYAEQTLTQMDHEVKLSDGRVIMCPDTFFQSIHGMLHLYDHFLYEGIGLRQVMDYYFVLNALKDEPDIAHRRHEVTERYKDFGIYKFSKSVMWVLQEAFGLKDNCLGIEPDASGGRKLLTEIMTGGNFGKASEENKVKHETFLHRMMRRTKRKIRLIKYNPIGVICAPYYKIRLLIWRQKVIHKYNL